MTSDFPLYNNLNKNIPKKDLSVKQKEEFIEKINNIDDENTKELIYVLIQYHAEKNKETYENIVYNGTKEPIGTNYNITWNFLEFPVPLKHILYNFVCHYYKPEGEENRF